MKTSYYYDPQYGSGRRNSGCLMFFRALLMGMNVLLTAGAIGGLAVGLIERNKIESSLNDLCRSCHAVFIAYISCFSALLGFSLLGFLALCTRNPCLRGLYFFYLLVVFVVALGFSVVYTLISTNRLGLEDSWNDSVANRGEEMCGLELQFECSGWKSLCHTAAVNNDRVARPLLPTPDAIMPVPNSSSSGTGENHRPPLMMMMPTDSKAVASVAENATTPCPVCPQEEQQKIDTYTETCESAVMDAFQSHMKQVLPIGFSVAAAAFIGMIVTCLLQRETNEEADYGGRYYRV
ncbi:hypothetical protein DQ04_02951060 [Trypanosoma grayi]|uniref:hypothetical protein n=1 Tax=Trypanosoma grayi TaxID=71804 RepID=UPI0004F489A3|nr:hypothetical protein DQ04_02951060 [Trypanosoma grayi]KEG11128.1 hypothetical protein DQ04_02951060 [Trypanosoma grayi]